MGSATVLMASGEELPDDVKCIISDCGFTSVLDEFKHELHQRHIPASLVLPTATLLSKKRVGYSFKEASTIEQVKKSKTPTYLYMVIVIILCQPIWFMIFIMHVVLIKIY